MRVHVDQGGLHVQKNHDQRKASAGQAPAVGLGSGMQQRAILDPAPVDERLHLASIREMRRRRSRIARDGELGLRVRDRQETARQGAAVQVVQDAPDVALPMGAKEKPVIVAVLETDGRMRQGVPLHQTADAARLGRSRFQKALPHRGVGEQTLDLDGGARRPAGGGALHDRAALQPETAALRGGRRPGNDGDAADRADAEQGLAPETEGGNGIQLAGFLQFAGGVPLKGQGQTVRRNARAVVFDLDELQAALHQTRLDRPRAGINAVLDQFLHRVDGAFDHFAGGNLGHDVGGEQLDVHTARNGTGGRALAIRTRASATRRLGAGGRITGAQDQFPSASP